jgi:hypothetical protein
VDELDALTARLKELIDLATDGLIADLGSSAEYQEIMSELLARYHTAAYLVGAGVDRVNPQQRRRIVDGVAEQMAYLERFTVELQGEGLGEPGIRARARMYAESVKVPYWNGRTRGLPLPSVPGDGTMQCLTNCKCSWKIETISAERGDYDATWERHVSDSCQTCVQRAAEWNPLRIRNGELQL